MAIKTEDRVARENRVHDCFSKWLEWDPDAAKQWLKTADFSEATKNRWLTEKEPPEF